MHDARVGRSACYVCMPQVLDGHAMQALDVCAYVEFACWMVVEILIPQTDILRQRHRVHITASQSCFCGSSHGPPQVENVARTD